MQVFTSEYRVYKNIHINLYSLVFTGEKSLSCLKSFYAICLRSRTKSMKFSKGCYNSLIMEIYCFSFQIKSKIKKKLRGKQFSTVILEFICETQTVGVLSQRCHCNRSNCTQITTKIVDLLYTKAQPQSESRIIFLLIFKSME